MKLPPLQKSQTNLNTLNTGLQMIGKSYLLNNREWVGKFGQVQNQHQYPQQQTKKLKSSQFMLDNLFRFQFTTKQVCGLCMVEKNKSQMEYLCRCKHKYCYSCLNSYAISKIQDLVPIKCPQQECTELMVLTSNVFRYLPDIVKLKYLENKSSFVIAKQDWSNKCQRCLKQSHIGQCKIPLSTTTVEQSFHHRLCPKCKVQIRLTSGKKKVTCLRCRQELCYLCGVRWDKGHECKDKDQVRNLQRINGYRGCCGCCCNCVSYGCDDCCVGCGDCCCRSCGSCCLEDLCCQVLFSCKDPGLFCCIWNIISIPVRILLTVLIFAVSMLFWALALVVLSLWLGLCIVVGMFGAPCELAAQTDCPYPILIFMFYPFVGIFGIFMVMRQTYKTPFQFIAEFLEFFCGILADIWVNLSPAKCDCN